MTQRSRRRNAELAVVEAAVEMVGLPLYSAQLPAAMTKIERAVRSLRAIDLEPANGVPLGNNQPLTS